jgi:hypothetical protein
LRGGRGQDSELPSTFLPSSITANTGTKGAIIKFRRRKREIAVAGITALNEMIDAGPRRIKISGSVCSHPSWNQANGDKMKYYSSKRASLVMKENRCP